MPEPAPQPAQEPHPDAAEPPINDPWRVTRPCVRRPLHCLLSPADGSAAVAAMAADCSMQGLGLMASRRFEPESAAVFRVAAAGPARPALDLPVRVAHRADNGAGWLAVGVEFLPPLTNGQAHALMARLNAAPALAPPANWRSDAGRILTRLTRPAIASCTPLP